FVSGALAVTNSLLFRNTARAGNGGSINASGNLTISLEGTDFFSRTVIAQSTALTNGGGIFAAGNALLVGGVFLDKNIAQNGEGGAIYTNDLIDAHGPDLIADVSSLTDNA